MYIVPIDTAKSVYKDDRDKKMMLIANWFLCTQDIFLEIASL